LFISNALFAGGETDRRDAPYLLEENSGPARQYGRSPFGLRWDDQILAARRIDATDKHIAQKTLPRFDLMRTTYQ
jgi:hypothetical protein